MSAPRASLRGPRRGACLVAGLLCALGVLSGVVLHASTAGHHRSPAVAVGTSIGHGHPSTGRSDHHVVAVAPVTVAGALRWERSVPPSKMPTGGVPIDSVRTRGPPVPA